MNNINSNVNYISNLPSSIKEEIFSYLDLPTVAKLSTVNKDIKTSIDMSNLWKNFFKKMEVPADSKQMADKANTTLNALFSRNFKNPQKEIEKKEDTKNYKTEVKNLNARIKAHQEYLDQIRQIRNMSIKDVFQMQKDIYDFDQINQTIAANYRYYHNK